MPHAASPVSLDDVRAAHERQVGVIRRTPMLTDPRLDRAVGRRAAVKGEHLQRGGSFKFRGLDNKIASLGDAAKDGIVVVSSGNAAQAAALSAHVRGIPCTVVMPDKALPTKVQAVESLGATIVRGGPTSVEMFATGDRLAAERSLHQVHAFDQPEVVAGHGSLALELLEDCPDVGTVYVPASGGGLLAAVALVVKSLAPQVRVVGVQPVGADSVRRSLDAGRPVPVDAPITTICDALTAQCVGSLTFEIIKTYVDDVVLVDDEQACAAMRTAWLTLRQAVEPGAATALAALMAADKTGDGTDVAVLSGGNVDLGLLAHVVAGGTAAEWRLRP
jgi:threonine dehydratase